MLLFSRFVLLVACCSLSRLAFIAESLKLVNVETILRVTSQELSYGPNKTMANSNTAQLIATASASQFDETLPPYGLIGLPSPAPGTGIYYPFHTDYTRLASSFQFTYQKDIIEEMGALQVRVMAINSTFSKNTTKFYSFCVVVVDNAGLKNLMKTSSVTPKKCSSFALTSISPRGQRMAKELNFNSTGIFPPSAAFRDIQSYPEYAVKTKFFIATANLLANSTVKYPNPSDRILNVVLYNNRPVTKNSVSDAATLSIRMLALVGKLNYPSSGK